MEHAAQQNRTVAVTMDSISVVIPVYNRSAVFQESLRSLFAQTYRPLEVIVVDDGSAEDIRSATESIPAPPDCTVHYMRQENAGAAAARNSGAQRATGAYIIFWDADIVANAHMLERMKAALDAHPAAAYAYSDFFFGRKKMHAGPFDPARLRKANYITTTSLLRRYVFPGFDVRLRRFQDWDLWLTLLKQGKEGVYVSNAEHRHIDSYGGTMSGWLPRCAYRWPIKFLPGIHPRVQQYEQAKAAIKKKHTLQ